MINVVSTFSGTGGSSLGYTLAGAKVLASLEFVKEASTSYRLNFKDTPIIEKDIRDVTGKEILDLIGLKKGELDILDGSPPCASYSINGKREKEWGKIKNYSNKKQKTDDLFDEQIRLIDEIRPKAIVIENVKGMALGIARQVLNNYLVKLDTIGYNVHAEILDASYFETATKRQRMIIIGFRKNLNLKPSHPKPFSKPITFYEATKNIENDKEEIEYLKKRLDLSKDLNNTIKKCSDGENFSKYKDGSYFSHARVSKNKPVYTITTRATMYHYKENRLLTIKELKAISSFPEDFKLSGTYDQQYERIGRAVPPNLMKHIARHVIKILTK